MSHAVVVINRPQANALTWIARRCPGLISPPAATIQQLIDRGLVVSSKKPDLPFETTPLGNATLSRYEAKNPSHRIPSERKRQESRP